MTSKMAIISTLITDQNQGTNKNRIYHTLLYRTAVEKKPTLPPQPLQLEFGHYGCSGIGQLFQQGHI